MPADAKTTTMPNQMTLSAFLASIEQAATPDGLEAALQAPFKHPFRGPIWSRISRVRIATGRRIVDALPQGFYIPAMGPRRLLTCCGETCRVASGGNSTGVRYAWHGAGEWAKAVLARHGFCTTAAHRLWSSSWGDYPHRCVDIVDRVLSGEVRDPPLLTLIEDKVYGPISYTPEQNEADRRASRPCACGGTLFDWGAGDSDGFRYVTWWCNKGSHRFTEYMTQANLYALRKRPKPAASMGTHAASPA